MTAAVAADRLRQIVARIERLNAEKDELNTDIAEVYKEAKGAGFDTKVLKIVIRDRKLDSTERQERDALYDVYVAALGGSGTTVATRAPARGDAGKPIGAEPKPNGAVPTAEASVTAGAEGAGAGDGAPAPAPPPAKAKRQTKTPADSLAGNPGGMSPF